MISFDKSSALYFQQPLDRSNQAISVPISDIDDFVTIEDDPPSSRLNDFNILPTEAINSNTSKKTISRNTLDEYSNDFADDTYARDENNDGIEIITITPDGRETNSDNRDNGKNEIGEFCVQLNCSTSALNSSISSLNSSKDNFLFEELAHIQERLMLRRALEKLTRY
ncbi:unnamed protein product [Rotaria sp. Silwood2]|nr:unnamed protein product [Rotaria sp. Silwood2]